MDQDMVMRARVQLLSANRRVVRGTEGLRIYRLLTQVEPEVYGSKLAYVLVEASASSLVRELQERQTRPRGVGRPGRSGSEGLPR
ncbi:hypothetical protein [Streptomyces sp. NPDC004270]